MHLRAACYLRSASVARLAWGALAAAACAPVAPQVPSLRLADLRPRERNGVYLNEPLVLHFSDELERNSVTERSVRIATPGGTPARGALTVLGRELTFVPDPVRAPDLQDGGYAPATTYVIELAGFPRAEALRSRQGACLPTTLRIEFKTVSIAEPRGSIFDDASPDKAKPLHIESSQITNVSPPRVHITPESGIDLEGEEPIDPSTIACDAFALLRNDASKQPYPLRPVLIDNRNKHAFPRQGTTIVRLVPHSLLTAGEYKLSVDERRVTFQDFSGRPIPVIGREVLKQLVVKVAPGEGDRIAGEYLEEFGDDTMRSNVLVPGVDGTALWSNTGRLEVRFPAAAGDGSDGEVVFGASERRDRASAWRLSVPAGVKSQLDAGPGLCVLASQSALEIAGSLTRAGEASAVMFPAVKTGDRLSEWLELQRGAELPLTVLVAGGDLLVRGELSVPGPLLLVAGGRVLVTGRVTVAGVAVPDPRVFRDHSKGGLVGAWMIPHRPGSPPEVGSVQLVLDPPRLNPLVKPLTVAVRSNPVPPDGRAVRWLSGEYRDRKGSGGVNVRYAGERFAGTAGTLEVLVDDPVLLVDCDSLRLVLTLLVPEAERAPTWDPPSIDAVRVRWKSQ